VLRIRVGEEGREYLKRFFPDFQKKGEWDITQVTMPEEYRKRVVCPKPFDIEKGPAPVKAHITFSFIYGGSISSDEAYLSNLIKSTKEGGYIMRSAEFNDKMVDKFDLERVPTNSPFVRVYRVR
jgi:hypothetical protein